MGNYLSFGRSSAGHESSENGPSQAYLYPPKTGNYFTSHFIMGGERFETSQPEMYLFGENLDLNFLGGKPSPFPYSAPLPHEPTRTLRSLINIRKESLRFVRVTNSALIPVVKPPATESSPTKVTIPAEKTSTEKTSVEKTSVEKTSTEKASTLEVPEKTKDKGRTSSTSSVGNVSCKPEKGPSTVQESHPDSRSKEIHYNIEFTFDCDVKCAVTIYYFATEEVSSAGVTYIPRDPSICSDTVVFKRGSNQVFTHECHMFSPFLYSEDDLMYRAFDENGYFDPRIPFPCVIHCVALEGDSPRQSHALIAVIEKNNNGSFSIKPFIQKTFIDGLFYLLQEIYGIENKNVSATKSSDQYVSPEDDIEDSGSECVVCLSDSRDTLILPCRHLCLCNACADSLRYQANNCPICRAPFRALLQIQAVRKVPRTIHMQHVIGSTVTPVSAPAQGLAGSTSDIVDVPPGYEPYSLIEALNGPTALLPSPPHAIYSFRSDSEGRTPLGVRRSLRRDRMVREDIPLPVRRAASSTPEVVVTGRVESPPEKTPSVDMTVPRKGSDGSTSNEEGAPPVGGRGRGGRLLGDHESTSSAGSSNTQETTRLLSGGIDKIDTRTGSRSREGNGTRTGSGTREGSGTRTGSGTREGYGTRTGCGDSKTELFEISDRSNLASSRKSSSRNSSRGRSSSPRTPKDLTLISHPSSGQVAPGSYAIVSLNDGYDEQQCMAGADEDSTPGSVTNIQSPTDDEDETRLFVDAASSFEDPSSKVSDV